MIFMPKLKVRSERKPGKLTRVQNSKANLIFYNFWGGLFTYLLFIGPAIVKTQRRNCHLKMNGSDMVWLAFQLELNYP